MDTPLALAQFVGPAIHVHAPSEVAMHEGRFAAGAALPCHVHETPVVSLVLEGSGVEEVRGRTRDVSAQDILFTPAYAPHGYRFGTQGRWFNIQLSDSWLARVTDGGPRLAETAQIIHSRTASAWAARVRAEVRERDAVSRLAVEGALLLMIADLVRAKSDTAPTRPRWLAVVEEALEESGTTPPELHELAALAGVPQAHLLRTFRRYHGGTIANWLRRRRVERARIEVARGNRPLSVIAVDAGFADQPHFNRAFRKAFGETPGEYARSLRRP